MSELQASERLAASLLEGTRPSAHAWEVAEAVQLIADAIGRRDPAVTEHGVGRAANALKKALLFEHTRLLASTWRDCRGFDATLEKLRAQALVDTSALDEAERVLESALVEVKKPGATLQAKAEVLELEGLRGRVAKQRFVNSGGDDLDALALATERYLEQYLQPKRPYWHGVNAMALVAREERQGSPVVRAYSSKALAQEVLAAVLGEWTKNPGDVWLPATASEAYLALGGCDEAELWLYRLLHHPNTEPFAVNAYFRQLREVWGGSPTNASGSCADRLASILARHVMRTEQRWTATPQEFGAVAESGAARAALEKNFTGQFGFTVDDVTRLLGSCQSIACITNDLGERLGTGFIVDGASLKTAWGSGPVLLTNAHVISDSVPNAIRPEKARATFELEKSDGATRPAYPVGEVLFTSPPDAGDARGFDVTVVRLQGFGGSCGMLPTARNLPIVDAKTRAYVIGHPRGSGLQISLHDSRLLDVDDEERRVHYRTPTDPGSSGSPVFNKDWQVMAIHHSGSSTTPRLHGNGTYEANEGIALSAIRAHLDV